MAPLTSKKYCILSNWGNGPPTKLDYSMKHKIVVISGGSRGIGLKTGKDLLRQCSIIIIGIRINDQS